MLRDALGPSRTSLADLWCARASRRATPAQRTLRRGEGRSAYDPTVNGWRLRPVGRRRTGRRQPRVPWAVACRRRAGPRSAAGPLVGDLSGSDGKAGLPTELGDRHPWPTTRRIIRNGSETWLCRRRRANSPPCCLYFRSKVRTRLPESKGVLDRESNRLEDPPLNSSWGNPTQFVQGIEAAQGMVADGLPFARLAAGEFLRSPRLCSVPVIGRCGYGPIVGLTLRVRKSAHGMCLLPWWLLSGPATANAGNCKRTSPGASFPRRYAGRERRPVAGRSCGPALRRASAPRFVLLWSEPTAAEEKRRILIDVSGQELTDSQAAAGQTGFCLADHHRCLDGQRGPAALCRDLVEPGGAVGAVADRCRVGTDRSAAVGRGGGAGREAAIRSTRFASDWRRSPSCRRSNWTNRRCVSSGRRPNTSWDSRGGPGGLDFLIDKKVVTATLRQYRAWTLARLGKAEEARAELAKYLEQKSDPSRQAYVQIVLAAWLGDRDDAARQLDIAVTLAGQNADDLYNAACAAALAAQACEKADEEQAKKLAERALELLTTAVTHGYQNARTCARTSTCGLHGDPRFTALLEKLEPPAQYAAVWRADVGVESRLVTGVDSPLMAPATWRGKAIVRSPSRSTVRRPPRCNGRWSGIARGWPMRARNNWPAAG